MLIIQTPLRISFAGGGTDLSAFYMNKTGMVISVTIDKYVYIIINDRYDDKIYVNYSKKEIVDKPEQVKHELVRETLLMSDVKKGIEISCLADIPSEGSGLGSSSSFAVGILNALYQYKGRQLAADWLAEKACEIEIERCKKPIGKQDQYAAAYGNINVFSFNKDDSVTVNNVFLNDSALRRFESNLLLFYTNVTRKSSKILKIQRRDTSQKKQTNILIKMRNQVLEIQEALLSENFDKVGKILDEGWELKKKLTKGITTSKIDNMYKKALKAGALGGKICGAGGGGFLLLYVPLEKQEAVRKTLKNYREMPFRFDKDGSKAIFNVRGNPWK